MCFHLYFPHSSNLVEIPYNDLELMLLGIYEFHKNWHREGHSFLMGINEIKFMYVL
jgi:hypothetical protein